AGVTALRPGAWTGGLANEGNVATAAARVERHAGGSRVDWDGAPDVRGFHGRAQELSTLKRWVLHERCRLVVLLGLGGIGKTMLAAKLTHDLAPAFKRV